MSERNSLAQSIAAFSKKFDKLDDADKELRDQPLSKEQLLQDEINRREEEHEADLRRRISDFLEPRTQDIEQDEEALIQAYELFCKLNEVCEAASKENSSARLRSIEISSPLSRRDDYTLGEEMSFLRIWFLQKKPDTAFIPQFTRDENGLFYLDFTDRELWTPSILEKEILRTLDNLDLN